MKSCVIVGCRRPVKARDLCRKHYLAAWRARDLPPTWRPRASSSLKKTQHQRFWEKVEKSSTCWRWTAAKSRLGYGLVAWWENGALKNDRAHRFAYRLLIGPIPTGMHVLHRCDDRLCVNPDHLWLGTHAENMRDMARKGRRKGINAGVTNGRAKLTIAQVRRIRKMYATCKYSQATLGERFGVDQCAISKIVRNLRYVE